MKCCACQADVEEGRAKCSVCGFPVIQAVDGSPEEFERINKMGRDYLRKKLEGITIGFTAYGYKMEKDELKLDKTVNIPLAQAEDMILGTYPRHHVLFRDRSGRERESPCLGHARRRRHQHHEHRLPE